MAREILTSFTVYINNQKTYIIKKQLIIHKPIQQNPHTLISHLYITIIIKLNLSQQVIELYPRVDLKLLVLSSCTDEVHVKDLEEVGLVLGDFDLFYEGLEEDLDGD